MELKQYQQQTLAKIQAYLQALAKFKEKRDKLLAIDADLAKTINPPKAAWDEVVGEGITYHIKKNGINEDLPNFNIKVPTGGGKTLLAVHTIDLINTHYLKKKTGFVLWIVPSNQIYRQTLSALRNREHPYRQVLDLSSGGRTEILEKMDRFTPQDVQEKLLVMLLMLPSANRQTKETLKIFRDAGGYESFFPKEDHYLEHEALLEKYPNLDYFGGEDLGLFGYQPKQVKTSLGNVLRILQPIVIVDEGQKAYSAGAQETIRGFNPSIVVELSATPAKGANSLVEIKGRDLDREEMIKLDLHVTNKSSGDWRDTLNASVEKREELERIALDYEAQSGRLIRPICLIQVERTGKDQRGKGYIHSEDVREYLIKECGIPPEHIAVKSSEKDDIEGIDLYSKECPIRYIITKQALQEGWDCSFAYVLTILTNPSSKNGITQLVGRILRQPWARKTKIKALDESYVFCFQQNANNLLKDIKKGLEGEGLGDLTSRIVGGEPDDEGKSGNEREINVKIRNKFKCFEGKIYLPLFLFQEAEHGWREVSYEMDILSRIDWSQVSLDGLEHLVLSSQQKEDIEISLGLSDNTEEFLETHRKTTVKSSVNIDLVMITRHIGNLIPNPWIAHELAEKTIEILKVRYSEDEIAANQAFIIEELKKWLDRERDRLAEQVFKQLIDEGKIQFLLEEKQGRIPKTVRKVKQKAKKLRHDNDEPVEKSLVEPVLDEEFDGLERSIALALDSKEKLLWWYRNIARVDYGIQGWRKNKIYPDFITAKVAEAPESYGAVYVLETKGTHLLGNDDTNYKKSIFDLCNELGRKTSWNTLGLEFEGEQFVFEIVPEHEWQRKINELFED